MNKIHLEYKWTVSRGRDTAGYNICTLRADGRVVARCNGGGYDMKGTNLGNWLAVAFHDRLLKLKAFHMPSNSHWQPDHTRVCASKCAEEAEGLLPRLPEDCWVCPTCQGDTRSSRDGKRIDDGRSFYGLRFVDPHYDPMSARLQKADGTFTAKADEGKTFRELQDAGKIVDLDVIRAWYKETSPTPSKRHTVPTIDGACGISCVEAIAKAIGVTFERIAVSSKSLDLQIAHVSERLVLRRAA